MSMPLPAAPTYLTCHNLMVLSLLADASKLPSGENDTLLTTFVCPLRVRTNEPSATRPNWTGVGAGAVAEADGRGS